MLENKLVWSLDAMIAYTDGSLHTAGVLQDFGSPRFINIATVADSQAILDIVKEKAFMNFLTTMGYTPTPGTVKATVRDYQFRFMAISTSLGSVHVAGSNKALGATVQSDNLSAILVVLHADTYFNAMLTQLAS